MLRGVLALLERSLRVDARSWQVHLARLGLIAAIYISLIYAFTRAGMFGAPGLRFFQANVYLNLTFMTLLGVGFFSTAITEEKEEDTLGLMQMAGIGPLGILLGKIGGRLFQALLLIAVQYPFTLLAVTMGGVTSGQVSAAYVGLTAYMLLLAGYGLLCSTCSPRSRTAGAWMILGILLYIVVPYACSETLRYLASRSLITAGSSIHSTLMSVAAINVFLQCGEILTSSYGQSPWSVQAVSNLVGGVVCFMMAVLLFGVCTRHPSTEATSRGLLTRQRGVFRWFSPGRPGINPFVWKDFHFVAGGVAMVLLRIAFYILLFWGCWLLAWLWWSSSSGATRFWREVMAVYQMLLLCLVTWEASLLAARSLHDEVRGQTLAALVMLPESVPFVVYSKFTGALAAAFPGVLCLAAASLLTLGGLYNTGEFLEEAAGWFFLAHFLLVPHLAAVAALSLRWGAVPLAIGGGITSLFGWVSLFEANHVSPSHGGVWVGTFFTLAVCVACHFLVIHRVTRLSER